MTNGTPNDRLHIFRPPYRNLIPLVRASVLESDAGRHGTVLVWTMSPAVPESVLQDVRQRPGGVSLVCILPPARMLGDRVAFYRMVERCLPAVVMPFHEDPNPFDLQVLLREGPEKLSADMMDYLTWRGVVVDTETRRLVRRTLELSADLTSVEALARGVYMSRRALGRRFQTSGIPVPSHWLHIGRVMRAAVRLQADDTPVNAISYDLGYADGFALSNQMHRLTGLRPSDIRGKLGWTWVVEAWLRQEAENGGFSDGLKQVIDMGGHRNRPRAYPARSDRRVAGGGGVESGHEDEGSSDRSDVP